MTLLSDGALFHRFEMELLDDKAKAPGTVHDPKAAAASPTNAKKEETPKKSSMKAQGSSKDLLSPKSGVKFVPGYATAPGAIRGDFTVKRQQWFVFYAPGGG